MEDRRILVARSEIQSDGMTYVVVGKVPDARGGLFGARSRREGRGFIPGQGQNTATALFAWVISGLILHLGSLVFWQSMLSSFGKKSAYAYI